MNSTLYAQAKALFAALPVDVAAQHKTAWQRIESSIRDNAPKGAKVFEVHHSIETARERYFAAMVEGKSPDECEAAAERLFEAIDGSFSVEECEVES
jgi:hypothetical protein